MPSSPRESVSDLLCANFSNAQLYAFIRTLDDGERICSALPEGFVSRRYYSYEATSALERHGALDRVFFDTLVKIKPKRRAEIQQTAALYITGYETPARVYDSPVSPVAILESALAAGISIFLAVVTQESTHIVLSAVLSPLTLLRSPASVETGRRWFISFQAEVESNFMIRRPRGMEEITLGWIPHILLAYYILTPIRSFLGFALTAIASVSVRAVATLVNINQGIRHFASNWRNAVFLDTFASSVELVPGAGALSIPIEDESGRPVRLSLSQALLKATPMIALAGVLALPLVMRILNRNVDINFALRYVVLAAIPLIYTLNRAISYIGYLLLVPFSFAVRLSVKSAWPLWAPLLYLSGKPYETELSAYDLCDFCSNSRTWGLIRGMAWATLLFAVVKIYDVAHFPVWPTWTEGFAWATTPGSITIWQATAVLQALVVLLVFYMMIDRAPINIRTGVWQESEFVDKLACFFRCNRLLTFVTVATLFWSALSAMTF